MELIHVKAKSSTEGRWKDITLNPRHIVKIEMRPEIEMVEVLQGQRNIQS